MVSSPISFVLKKTEGVAIGIGDVAKVLKGIQDSVYHIGEYLFSGTEYRKAGKRNKTIEKRTKLQFKSVGMGSFKATIVGEPQQAILGETLVEKSVETFATICNSLNSEEDWEITVAKVNEMISEPLQKSRIIGDIAEFWPGGDNEYELEMNAKNVFSGKMLGEKRQDICRLAKLSTRSKGKTTFGLLSMSRSHPKKVFEIIGPDGKIVCKFSKEIIDKIQSYWSKIVTVTGTIKIDEGGNIKEISELTDIKLLNKIPLNRILTEDGELYLKNPIEISISFHDENKWVLEHTILNIIATGETYDEALSAFQEDFYFLYRHYYLGNPKDMVGKALEIRSCLKNILGEG